jgi:pyruvate dehydrogenase E2 component (dihydrolipoamide acetyltransferase)
MPADVIMPMLGMAQESGKVLRWLKEEGESVRKGEPLLEVETDKVTVEIEAPADGTLAAVRVPNGADVPVGEVIACVLSQGEVAPTVRIEAIAERETAVHVGSPNLEQVTTAPTRRRRRLASPKARRLAHERGIDLDSLGGSGPNGAIVAADVERSHDTATHLLPTTPLKHEQPVAVSNVWRIMAERTQRSWQEVPHFFLHRNVDATGLQRWREASQYPLSMTDLLIRVCAESLRRHPRINASWRDGTIVPSPAVNVAIAVATDAGLVVPVVHDADQLTLPDIAARRAAIVEAAREGRLRPDDVTGGTFTISNLGMFGVDAFEAIVNAPQAAILAVGRITKRPWIVEDLVVARPVMTLSVSFDHRVVDGARGAEFLDTLASLIEEPVGLVA